MTLPANHGVGQSGHVADHNLIESTLNAVKTTADAAQPASTMDAATAAQVSGGAQTLAALYRVAPPTGVAATDTANLQAAINAAITSDVGGLVLLDRGYYAITNGSLVVNATYLPRIIGHGKRATFLQGAGAGQTLTIQGTPGTNGGGYVGELGFNGTGDVALAIEGGTGIEWDIAIGGAGFTTGVLLHNKAASSFTEFCRGRVYTDTPVVTALEYRVTSGNSSFHGSGLTNQSVINQPASATAPSIKIGAGAEPYNAPLDATVFVRTDAQPIILNSGISASSFYGTLGVELVGVASATLADTGGNSVYLVGGIHATVMSGVSDGNLIQCFRMGGVGSGGKFGYRVEGPETSWTPTLTNVTLGDGTLNAYYKRTGTKVSGSVEITLGSTSAVSGVPRVSLPVKRVSTARRHFLYSGDLIAGGARYKVDVLPNGDTDIDLRAIKTSAADAGPDPISATVPGTWAAGDVIFVSFQYEAAILTD